MKTHGATYWMIVGWWWAPLKWAGRVVRWLVFWPVGLWRSMRHSRQVDNRRIAQAQARTGE